MKNVLIIAPHADDEILGCGAAISYYKRKRYKVHIAIMTNANIGSPSKFLKKEIDNIRKESLKAHKFLKVDKTFFYNFPAPKLNQSNISDIADEISVLLKKIKPSIVFVPHHGDSHDDHNVINKASLVALRPMKGSYIQCIYAYETLSETEWGINDSASFFIPNVYLPLDSIDINNKIQSMKLYKSQIKKFPHPRSSEGILNLSKVRGQSICKNLAESYMLIRSIIK